MNIYVGNLPYSMTEEELKEVFKPFGGVESATIIKDKFSGESRGFGFVEMGVKEEAERAIQEMSGQECQGRKLIVNEARPREERPPRSSGGYQGGGRSDRGDLGGRGGFQGGGRSDRGDRGDRGDRNYR